MRLARTLLHATALGALLASPPAVAQTAPPAPPGPPAATAAPPAPENPADLLGNIVVVAGGGRSLPKIALLPSLVPDAEDVTVHSVMRRDLDLSGEFEVIPDAAAPPGSYADDSPVDVKAWGAKGALSLVKVTGKRLDAAHVVIAASVYFVAQGPQPVFTKRFSVPAATLREDSHRVADLVIGALTGQNGGFASHLAFSSGLGGFRRVYTMDADGHDAKPVSPPDKIAIAPAFGDAGKLYYAAESPSGEYKVETPLGSVAIPYKGSVYGIAFSRDHKQVAVSLGTGDTVRVFSGTDFAALGPASQVGMALHPTFTPSGKLAFSGEGRYGQRIFVEDKPISPEGISASSPVFCNHPDGVRAVFSVGVGRDTDLVATGERGGALVRLTQNQGRNGYPACSPDGRLIAFFSTRTTDGGPGLFIMRIDGGRPKLVSPLIGDMLRWDALPPGAAVELKN